MNDRRVPVCFVILHLVCAAAAAQPAREHATWPALALPVGADTLRCLIAAPAHVPDHRLVAEFWHRAAHRGLDGDDRARVSAFADWLDRLQRDLDAGGTGAIHLDDAQSREGRGRLSGVLAAFGLRVRSTREGPEVEVVPLPEGDPREAFLRCLGIDPLAVAATLNEGGSFEPLPVADPLPVPLDLAAWRIVLGQRQLTATGLLALLFTDMSAGLVHTALSDMDEESRRSMTGDPELVRGLIDRAPLLAQIAPSLRVRGRDLEIPGGPSLAEAWRRIVGRSHSDAGAFVRELVSRDGGATALFYRAMASLPELDVYVARGELGAAELVALYDVFRRAVRAPDIASYPFVRLHPDPAVVLLELFELRPFGPPWRRFWEAAIRDESVPDGHERFARQLTGSAPIDLPGLFALVLEDPLDAYGRLAAVGFASRRLSGIGAGDAADAVAAVAGYRRFPALGLLLDRIGVDSPGVMAGAFQRAERLTRNDEWVPLALAQWQGILSSIHLAAERGSLARARALSLVEALVREDPGREGFQAHLLAFMGRDVMAALGATIADAEDAWFRAVVGTSVEDGRETMLDGLPFRIAIRQVKLERALAARRAQRVPSLAHALALGEIVLALPQSTTVAEVHGLAETLSELLPHLPASFVPMIGPPETTDFGGLIAREIRALRNVRSDDRMAQAAARIAGRLVWIAEEIFARALVSAVYAAELGGDALRPEAVAGLWAQHDFGFEAASGQERARLRWEVPHRRDPSLVRGALLNLDLAFGSRLLRRPPMAPIPRRLLLQEPDLVAMGETLAMLANTSIAAADLQAAQAALERGRAVLRAQENGSAIMAAWWAGRTPEIDHLDARLGVARLRVTAAGRRLPRPHDQRFLEGHREPSGLLAGVAAVNLRITEFLAVRRAPGDLLPPLAGFAYAALLDEAPFWHPSDRGAALAFADTLSDDRLEGWLFSLSSTNELAPPSQGPP